MIAESQDDEGFTLIELLFAITVVGILAAVAAISITSVVDRGSNAACNTTRDATEAAYVAHYANSNGAPPPDLNGLVTGGVLRLAAEVTVSGDVITANSWTLTRTAGPPVVLTCVVT